MNQTGPRTSADKARSASNAIKHVIAPLLRGMDRETAEMKQQQKLYDGLVKEAV